MVGPGVEVAGASQGLSEMSAYGLAHMVDDDNGDVVTPLELAQIAEQCGDVGRAIRRADGAGREDRAEGAWDGGIRG
jgi:hypothetical protein